MFCIWGTSGAYLYQRPRRGRSTSSRSVHSSGWIGLSEHDANRSAPPGAHFFSYNFHTVFPPTIVRTARPFSGQPSKGVLREAD